MRLEDIRQRVESRSWTKAIGRYHSNTPHLGRKYRVKVLRSWRDERHRANRARRAARLAQAEAARTKPAAPAKKPAARDKGQIIALGDYELTAHR